MSPEFASVSKPICNFSTDSEQAQVPMVIRKGSAKTLPGYMFSRNENAVDTRTQFTDTQDTPHKNIAQNCSQVPYKSSLIFPWINIMLDQ